MNHMESPFCFLDDPFYESWVELGEFQTNDVQGELEPPQPYYIIHVDS